MNGWKVTALIFIALSLLETSLITYMLYIGFQTLEREDKCSLMCREYEGVSYDSNANLCSCWNDGKIVQEERIP